MYLLIPFILIIVSVGGILYIVLRKLPRLEELAEIESNSTVTGSSSGDFLENGWRHIFYDLCPEVWSWVKGVKAKEYKELWLVETEKLLRRLRVASMKMDRFSDSLIKKVRSKNYSNNAQTYAKSDAVKHEESKSNEEVKNNEREEFKKTEQRLILEIAKNPKNAVLYEELGDLYSEAGEHKDAKESYEAAIELNSNSEELNKKLSLILEKLNKPEGSQN